MPTQVSDNALRNFKLSKWNRHQNFRKYFTWLSCVPTNQRVPDEFYAIRIDINEDEVKEKPPELVMELVRFKIETALMLMDSYREVPPPLKNPFTQEEIQDADSI